MADRFAVSTRDRERAGSRFGMDRGRDEPDVPKLRTVPREEFVDQFAQNYTPSHVTFIGPTRRGKSTLCFQLLEAVLARHKRDRWTAVVLHGKIKKRDQLMLDSGKKPGHRVIKSWPPTASPRPRHMKRNVRVYILLPLGNDKMPAAEEKKVLKAEFSRAIRANYHSTRRVKITVIDERAQADKDLKLTEDLDAPLQRGLPHNPEWNNIQRGAWCSYHCYDAPEHVFLFFDDDDSNVERYAEFGIGDPRGIKEVLKGLKTKKSKDGGTISQCLYMRRSDRFMCIVDT
jgi:hypothetical protein